MFILSKKEKKTQKQLNIIFSFILILNSLLSFVPISYAQVSQASTSPDATISALLNPSPTDANAISLSFQNINQNAAAANLNITPPVFVETLAKSSFQAKEKVDLVVKNSTNENLNVTVDGGFSGDIKKNIVNGDTVFSIYPSANFIPGRYSLKVVNSSTNEILSEQGFTWGVLAINTNKSIYLPNETAKIALAVLDENGNMDCHAVVNLDITSPFGNVTHLSTDNGTVIRNQECWLHQYTQKPDYEASFNTTDIGRYFIKLSATTNNGIYTTKDRFEVRNYVSFDVERDIATRIYPPDKYPVRLKITANESFKGKIVETVPSDFQISTLDESGVIAYQEEVQTPVNSQTRNNYGIPRLSLPFDGDYSVSLGFGQQLYDKDEIDIYKKSGLDGHDGIDFALPIGTPVLSVDDGKIILAKQNWIYGTTIVVQHSWGRSYYGHLSKLEVSEGDNIIKGQEIGLSGQSGLATGPHLHFGLKPNNYDINNLYFGKIDPAPFFGISSDDPNLSVSDYPIDTKALVWNVDIEKGASFILGYRFLSPPKSPNFYTLGPLQFITSEVTIEPQAKFDVNPFVLGAATSSGVLISTESAVLGIQTQQTTVNNNIEQTQPNQVIFAEIRPWQLAIDAAKTTVLTTSSSSPWSVPLDWNNSNYSIEVVGSGGNGVTGLAAGRSGGGGAGGAYSKTTQASAFTLTGGNSVTFQVGTAGGGVGTGDSYFCRTNGGANCSDSAGTFGSDVIAGAHAGGNGSTNTGGTGGSVTGAVGDTGAKFAGGNGGNGSATARTAGGGGGGAAGPNGAGGNGGASAGSTTNEGGPGGGGNGAASGNSSTTPSSTTGTAGGAGAGTTGGNGGTGGTTTCNVGNNTTASANGGGGGGGGGTTGNGAACNGGDGSKGTEWSSFGFGSGGGGGAGGGSARTSGTNNGGNGGNPVANTGAGGGGGGSGNSCSTACLGRSGSAGFIVITYTPASPTLDQLLRHGEYIIGGVKEPFTF